MQSENFVLLKVDMLSCFSASLPEVSSVTHLKIENHQLLNGERNVTYNYSYARYIDAHADVG